MAQKFGGKYSPGGDASPPSPVPSSKKRQKTIVPGLARTNVLFVPAGVLAVTSLGSGAVTLGLALVGAATLTLAAWLTREGLRAEAAYNARPVARRPALPRKMIGSVLTGAGLAIAAVSKDPSLTAALLYGAIGAGLHSVAFGIDPLQNKRMEGVDEFQQDRVARVVDEAEAYLGAMTAKIAELNDRPLALRVAGVVSAARAMIDTVQADPRDLTDARRYLGVYLMGARDATTQFVDHFSRTQDAGARRDFEALLTDLETNYGAATQRLLLSDRTALDVEIKVLRDRLHQDTSRHTSA